MTTRFLPGDNLVVENAKLAIGITTSQLNTFVKELASMTSAGYASPAAAREITSHITRVQIDLRKLNAILSRQAGWKG